MGHFGSFSCSSALVDVQALNQKDFELTLSFVPINSFTGVIFCDCLPTQTRCRGVWVWLSNEQLDFYCFLQKFEILYFEILGEFFRAHYWSFITTLRLCKRDLNLLSQRLKPSLLALWTFVPKTWVNKINVSIELKKLNVIVKLNWVSKIPILLIYRELSRWWIGSTIQIFSSYV